MAVKIRLNRIGSTKRPYYRLVAIDSRSKRNGRFLEILGTYDPLNTEVAKDSDQKEAKGRVNLKSDRIQHWIGVGAELSPTVKSILKRMKIAVKTAA
jgi:small subunit ribosomal protein S16